MKQNYQKFTSIKILVVVLIMVNRLASRCIYTISIGCNFELRNINDGGVVCRNMYFSGMGFDSSCALFPIVSLSSSLISKDASNNFTVNI